MSTSSFEQTYRDLRTFNIVHLCLSGILILPVVALWIVSFCVVRARGDPVRSWPFTWMKVAFPMFALAILFIVATLAISVVIYTIIVNNSPDISESFLYSIEQAADHLWETGLFFTWMTMLALILCVVELGLAFLRIWHGAKTTWHNIVRYVAIAFSFIVFVLALGHFGKMHSLLAAQYDALRSHTYFSTSFSGSFYSMIKLRSAIDILIFVASVALTAFTGLVFAMSSKTAGQSMRKSARIFLVIGILLLIRCTWKLAYDAAFLLPIDASLPNWPDAVDPILDDWVIFIVLVLIFIIGSRKRDGLWSIQHAWNDNAAQWNQNGYVASTGYQSKP